MQLYDFTVRLGGSMKNEVPLSERTAAELLILEAIHGQGNITNVTRVKDADGMPKLTAQGPFFENELRGVLVERYPARMGEAGTPIAVKVLADNGFGNKLPDAIEDVAALKHLADILRSTDEDRAALEASITKRVEARAAEARALLEPEKQPAPAVDTSIADAEDERLAALKTSSAPAGADGEFG